MAETKTDAAAVESGSNISQRIPYEDLRGWLVEAERLGELEIVRGANWQEEIGMAAEVVSHADDSPAVLFDAVPGCPAGFRLLTNIFAGRRKNMTLGFPEGLDKVGPRAVHASQNRVLAQDDGPERQRHGARRRHIADHDHAPSPP